MNKFDKIEVSKFDYNLSEDKIAKYPLFDRDQSKLLIYDKGKISDDKFYNIPNYIDDDSLLIFNNTRVIHARLIFSKETGASIEIFCLMPYAPPDYNLSFVQRSSCIWRCMVGNLKKWKGEDLVKTVKTPKGEHKLKARLLEKENNTALIKFFWDDDHVTFAELVEAGGVIPIPPYLNRKSEALDKSRYQTVYSKQKGSVAAPTAGLHFTDNVMKGINQKKVTSVEVTLHVGAGTFTPVKSGNVSRHEMHQEYFCVPAETIKLLMSGKKIIPVGTTSLRTIESLYWMGVKLHEEDTMKYDEQSLEQWEAYKLNGNISVSKSLSRILDYLEYKGTNEYSAITRLMIIPGYRFKVAQELITNFHQPKSTLLMLVAAFIGEDWRKVYDYALSNDFRMLSYGDSSLLKPLTHHGDIQE